MADNPTVSELKLLDLTLKQSGSIPSSAMGEFTAPGRQEIAAIRSGGAVELYRIETTDGGGGGENEDEEDEDEEPRTVLKLVSRVETRSTLRCLCAVRLSGGKRDVLAVGADGGCLTVLDFEGGKGTVLHCATFGKTGCRRGTPGQYLASDPKGRAVMIAAVEKRKLVYVLNRDSAGRPTIASPLEAHRSRTIVLDTVGLDNGYDNPIFASLEFQYPDVDDEADGGKEGGGGGSPEEKEAARKQLAYYELDLGLNHVSRRWATSPAVRSACCLAALPGGADGPGGVLVGGEDFIEYLHEGMEAPPPTDGAAMNVDGGRKATRIVCAIPRRKLHPPSRGVLVQTVVVHRQKKGRFFALAQSELGDAYKVTVRLDPDDKTRVVGMTVCLLDTLPVGNALNVSKKGLLFVPAEFGDHDLYQFERIDLEGTAPTCTSEESAAAYLAQSDILDEGRFYSDPSTAAKIASSSSSSSAFVPTVLKNLRRIHSVESLAPVTGVLVGELAGGEVSPQIYALCGRGPRSCLRVLRHGAAVTELAVSDLPGVPGAVYTVADNSEEAMNKKRRGRRPYDKYIVVSFADATMVLSVGEAGVEEMGKESGFLPNAPTLACSALGRDGGICQIHPGGVRHIHRRRAKQWDCPGLKRIECASANESQVVIALAGGEVTYFELDPVGGKLMESATRNMGADVSCLDVGTIREGRARSMFAAVGCRDQTVRVVSLEQGKLLTQRSSTALRVRPHSVALQHMSSSSPGTDGSDSAGAADDIVLTVGLDDGSALRSSVDPITGAIGSSPARRFLGARPVSVNRIALGSSPAALLLSSRPWIGRPDPSSPGKHVLAPLSYAPLDHGCAFSSEAVREGIVATAGTTLRILSVEAENGTGLGAADDEAFNSNKVELTYTPRGMCLLATGGAVVAAAQGGQPPQRKLVLAVVEADCNDYGAEEKNAMGFDPSGGADEKKSKKGKGADKKKDDDDDAMEMDESDDEEDKKEDDDDKPQGGSDEEDDDEDEEERAARATPIRGPVPPSSGHWGSCVRLLDPSDGCSVLDNVEMGRNEAALCCCSVRFHSRGGEALLAVGTVTNMTVQPRKQSATHIVLYRVVNGERLQLLHRTEVDSGPDGGPVLALAHFQGRLLAGAGRTLRLYEMGKRQLLRKCELRGLPSAVKSLQAAGDRAYVGDLLRSVSFVRYDAASNRLVLAAADRNPRPVVCQEVLDFDTVAVGDKFGNVSVLRLPRGAEASAVDVSGNRALWDASRDDSTPRLEVLCHYHVGEIVTGLTRASLVAGGAESLVYTTVTGRIGALVPFSSRDDIEFYSSLESSLRTDAPRPTGREQQAYRSYYAPVKHVIDGDFCGTYRKLGHDDQKKIADRQFLSVAEVVAKLEDTRNTLL